MLALELISKKLEENREKGLYRKIPEFLFEQNKIKNSSASHSKSCLNNMPCSTSGYNYSIKFGDNEKKGDFINLATNDYLGLSSTEKIKNSAKKAIDIYGTSSSSSFLIYGHTAVHKELEDTLCKFKGGYERCLLYPSGYQANIGIIKALSVLSPAKTFIAFDELSHASIIDGVMASGVKFKSFKHNDLGHLENILIKQKDNGNEVRLLITEGVFSMDGDIPDLPGILRIAKKFDSLSLIDDAHATGTIGAHGGGSVDFHGVKPDIIIGTLGKALASGGAFVLSDNTIIEYLINFSRPFIFSTGLPPSSAAAALEALKIVAGSPELVDDLQNYAKFARSYLKNAGLNTLDSTTHIIPILIGDEKKAVKIEKILIDYGIYIKAVRYPAVPKKNARLRLSINAGIGLANLKKVLKNIVKVIGQVS